MVGYISHLGVRRWHARRRAMQASAQNVSDVNVFVLWGRALSLCPLPDFDALEAGDPGEAGYSSKASNAGKRLTTRVQSLNHCTLTHPGMFG